MIQYEDLLRRPHEPLRCLGYVLLVLQRAFKDFDREEIPSTPEAARAWLESPPRSRWREIGKDAYCARRVGDVVYGEDESEAGGYVAVLVNEREAGFLTSTQQEGCHIRNRRSLLGVKSVQRRL